MSRSNGSRAFAAFACGVIVVAIVWCALDNCDPRPADRSEPSVPTETTRPTSCVGSEVAPASKPSPHRSTAGNPPIALHELLALADADERRKRFQAQFFQSDESLLSAILEILSTGSDSIFDRGGTAEALFYPLDHEHWRPIAYESLATLLQMARNQVDPSRRSFLYFVACTGLCKPRPREDAGSLQAFLAIAEEVLRHETDDRNVECLLRGMDAALDPSDRAPIVTGVRSILENEQRSLKARTQAALFLGPGAASWDTESLNAMLRPIAGTNATTARAFVAVVASLAGKWPSTEGRRRALATLADWLSSHPELAADEVDELVCCSLAENIRNRSQTLYQALTSQSPVDQGAGLSYIISGNEGDVTIAEANAVFSIAEGEGPAWLRRMALKSILAVGEQHGFTEQAIAVLERVRTNESDASIRQEASSTASFLRGTNPGVR